MLSRNSQNEPVQLDLSEVRPPSFVELPPTVGGSASAVVVVLHGLGDTTQGMPLQIVNTIRKDPVFGRVKWILPQAPHRVVTGNMSKNMPAWFDMYHFNLEEGDEDERGMLHSVASIDALLSEIAASGVDPSRIILGGFSQGAAMTLLTGLTTTKKLGGLFVLSGRLPLRNKIKSMVSAHAGLLPLFWGHGTKDILVTYKLGRVSADFITTEIGLPAATSGSGAPGIDFHVYNGLAHYISDAELTDLAFWLKKVLPPMQDVPHVE
ncbi:lysophospholipase I [Mycena maculata]|uniref:Acyl-protein thioesterase 1 n=1 Tax=Mycena maculata TaxID=230809 RepID=A0AAD7HD96_9AGAR|nr:lysophospholipase I [Mycena maculata]